LIRRQSLHPPLGRHHLLLDLNHLPLDAGPHAASVPRFDPRSRSIRFWFEELLDRLRVPVQAATSELLSYVGTDGCRFYWSCTSIMPAVSLEALQQQITQREQELQAMRRELETRQNELASLPRCHERSNP
jgi:hypothetical protein